MIVLLGDHSVGSVGVYFDIILQPGNIGMGSSMYCAHYFFFFAILGLDQNIFYFYFRSI